ncbi:MAG: S8 family serine peptidase [Synechococcales bacterium]|nr:S8 family serine peptidase [Synechococcales bacterium]
MFTTNQTASSLLLQDSSQTSSSSLAFNPSSPLDVQPVNLTNALRSSSSWAPEQIPFSTYSVSSPFKWPDVVPKVDLAANRLIDNAGSDFLGDRNNPFDDVKFQVRDEFRLNNPSAISQLSDTLQITRQTQLGNFAQNLFGSPAVKIVNELPQIQLPSTVAIQSSLLADLTKPTIFSQNGLTFSGNEVMENRTFVVESGDINFNTAATLKNVTLIAKTGSVNLGDIQGENIKIWAANSIHMNQGARFGGDNLFVTDRGDMIWNGATKTLGEDDRVKTFVNGNIFWNSTANTRGEFWTSGNFIANQSSELKGAIYAQDDIIFNAKMKVTGEWGRAEEAIATAIHQLQDMAQILEGGIAGLDEKEADRFSEAELNQMELELTTLLNQIPPETLLANPLRGDTLINYAEALPKEFIPNQFPTPGFVPNPLPLPDFAASVPFPTLPQQPQQNQPLIGLIDTGIHEGNPQIDYNRLIAGYDYTDNDANPFLPPKSALTPEDDYDDHGTQMLEIMTGLNPDAPKWVSRSVDSGDWTLAVREFVDVVKQRNLPHGMINLSFDLLGIPAGVDPKGEPITRPYLTRYEYHALRYAQENGVLVVVSAGNEGENRLTALARASRYLDNVLVVGAATGDRRAGYSNYGKGLGLLTDGSGVAGSEDDWESPPTDGTSAASARVAAIAAQIWAVNPNLSYRQVMDILQATARDLGTRGWDEETGAGLMDAGAAIAAASTWAQPASQLETEKTLEDLVDDFTVWATTYQRPNGRCWKTFWKKLRRVFKKILKIAGKVIGFVLKNIGTIAAMFTGIGGVLGVVASKVLTGTVFKVVSGAATFLSKVGEKIDKFSTNKTFVNVKKAYEGITSLVGLFKVLLKP